MPRGQIFSRQILLWREFWCVPVIQTAFRKWMRWCSVCHLNLGHAQDSYDYCVTRLLKNGMTYLPLLAVEFPDENSTLQQFFHFLHPIMRCCCLCPSEGHVHSSEKIFFGTEILF
jgi:hypothetical protein